MNRLYHGTSAKLLDRIKEVGLQPRAVSRHKGNWNHTVPSNRKSVYLTDTYPFHFAAGGGRKELGLILEINRDLLIPWKLCPDEDALEQGTRKQEIPGGPPLNASMKERTKAYRKLAPLNPQLAQASLETLGTVGYYGTIPFRFVTRYVIIDWTKMDMNMYLNCVDTSVSVLNFRILAERHKAMVRWLFGDPVTVEDLMGFWHGEQLTGQLAEMENRRREGFAQAMANRDALTVTVLKPQVDPFNVGRHGPMERSPEV